MSTCESGKCTRVAVYHCTIMFINTKDVASVRDYCPHHVSELARGMVELIDQYDCGTPLSTYLDVGWVRSDRYVPEQDWEGNPPSFPMPHGGVASYRSDL